MVNRRPFDVLFIPLCTQFGSDGGRRSDDRMGEDGRRRNRRDQGRGGL